MESPHWVAAIQRNVANLFSQGGVDNIAVVSNRLQVPVQGGGKEKLRGEKKKKKAELVPSIEETEFVQAYSYLVNGARIVETLEKDIPTETKTMHQDHSTDTVRYQVWLNEFNQYIQ